MVRLISGKGKAVRPDQRRADRDAKQLCVSRPGDLSGDLVLQSAELYAGLSEQFATSGIADPHPRPGQAGHRDGSRGSRADDQGRGGGHHARKFVADFGIERFYDVGRHGICHQFIAENGLARPGEVLASDDSHTCAGGAYNTAARGHGPAEVYSIVCTGTTWYQIAPTIRYEVEGVKPSVVSGKDIFLHIANEFGDAANLNLEFGGQGLAGIPMHDRRTIATQGAEVSADFSTFEADAVLTEFFDGLGVSDYVAAQLDPDAVYREVRRIDLGALQPYVARPGTGQPQRVAGATARQAAD